jgi:hypothetical protein
MCASELVYYVSKNGISGDWYWEVMTPEGDIMARGLAATSTQARADAVVAGGAYTIKQPRLPASLFGGDALTLSLVSGLAREARAIVFAASEPRTGRAQKPGLTA